MELVLIIFNIIFPASCISISYLYKKHYPSEINSIIGYRTKRSMISREAWIFANRYSSNLLFNYSLVAACIHIVLFIFLRSQIAILVAIGLWIAFLFLTIAQTENKLKRSRF